MKDLIDELISAVTACEQASTDDAQEEVNRLREEILTEYARIYNALESIAMDANDARLASVRS